MTKKRREQPVQGGAMKADRLRIMILEDETAHVEAIRRAWEDAETDVEIQVAGTLREYHNLVNIKPPDIALVDMMLPDGRAFEVLTQPPEDGLFPVLIMTSYGNEKMAVEALKAGALDYIVKSPDAFTGISHTLSHALREWRLLQERKRADEEKIEMERLLFHAQKLESIGVLAGGLAHDFNNLLMVILGNLDLAMEYISPVSAARACIENAVRSSKRAADLTQQMLAYSGKGKFLIRKLNLSEMVEGNIQIFGAAVPKNVTLNLQLTKDIPLIMADVAQVQQVVMNLITNASEAIGEMNGVLTLLTGVEVYDEVYLKQSRIKEKLRAGRFVYLDISDTGCGMDEKTQSLMFDPFFTTKFTGRGLGMAAVFGIVRGHKGALFVNSRVGRGTTVRVLFPALEMERVADEPAGDPAADQRVRYETPHISGTILVVDDEAPVRDLCKAMVEHFGYRVVTAVDGEDAIEVFRKHADEIVCAILDLTMPRMDGIAAYMELRGICPDLKVILSSGFNQQEATQRFTSQGLAGFIKKPYGIKVLQNELERVLKGRRHEDRHYERIDRRK